jgi:hypothetical protein
LRLCGRWRLRLLLLGIRLLLRTRLLLYALVLLPHCHDAQKK